MCLSICAYVCPRAYFPITRTIFTKCFVQNPNGKGQFLVVFFPIDNVLYSSEFGTYTKTVEPIKMPFGMMTWVDPRYHVLDGDPIPQGKGQFVGGKRSGPL